jgi:sulfur carrier protein ThiS adenylyltransferase
MDFQQIKTKLKKYSVGIAGAGGLGSNCAVALARVGIGKLIIADFDVVDESNLNRQYYFRNQIGMKKVDALKANLLAIDSTLQLEMYDLELKEVDIQQKYARCDVIVEAFDKASEKEMLIETVLSYFPDKPLVVGLGMAGFGDSNAIQMQQNNQLYVCGDGGSEVSPQHPPLAPRVGIVAHMQANTVLEILLKK